MTHNLLAEMAKKKVTKKSVAETIDVNQKTLWNKIEGVTAFTFPETLKIRDTFFPGMELDYLFAVDNEADSVGPDHRTG